MNVAAMQDAIRASMETSGPMTAWEIARGVDATMRSALCHGVPVTTPGPATLAMTVQPALAASNGNPGAAGRAWVAALTQWIPMCLVTGPAAVPPYTVIPDPGIAALGGRIASIYASRAPSYPVELSGAILGALGRCTALFSVGGVPTPFPLV